MTIANVNPTNTFEDWRKTTNQLIVFSYQTYDRANAAWSASNAAYNAANVAFSTAAALTESLLISNNIVIGILSNTSNAVANAYIQNSDFVLVKTQANAAYLQSNAAYLQSNITYNQSNIAYLQSNVTYNQSNTALSYATIAYNQSNTSYLQSNTAYLQSNVAYTQSNAAYTQSNTALTYSTTAYNQSNAAVNVAISSIISANNLGNTVNVFIDNVAFTVANILASNSTFVNTVNSSANAAIGTILNNTTFGMSYNTANAGYDYANSVGLKVNTSFGITNSVFTLSNNAFDKANAANVLAYNTGISANAYAGAMANSVNVAHYVYANATGLGANNYAGAMANASNTYANNNFLKLSGGTLTGSLTASGTISANSYVNIYPTDASGEGGELTLKGSASYPDWHMDSLANGLRFWNLNVGSQIVTMFNGLGGANSVFLGVNRGTASYALDVFGTVNASAIYVNGADAIAAGNNYAGAMANAANAISNTNDAAGNGWSNIVASYANNYAGTMANAANAYATSYAASVGAAANSRALANTTNTTFNGDLYVAGSLLVRNGALFETRQNMGTSNNFNLASANYFTKSVSGSVTLTFTNYPVSGNVSSFILELANGGSSTITWWSGIKWAGGNTPIFTTTGKDVLGFYSHDGGITWTGLLLAKDIK